MNTKNLIMNVKLSITLVLLTFSFAAGQDEIFQDVGNKKIPDILITISTQSKQNFERLHTWQGELESSRMVFLEGKMAKDTFKDYTDAVGQCPNEISEIDSSRIVFKCDLDKGLFYAKRCRETPTRYVDSANGRDLGTKTGTRCSSHIMTNEYKISTNPNMWMKGVLIQRKAIKEKIDKDNIIYLKQPPYLPGYLLDLQFAAWEIYPNIAKTIKEKPDSYFTVVTKKYLKKLESVLSSTDFCSIVLNRTLN